jgi:type 1 glutamine amidotransferase
MRRLNQIYYLSTILVLMVALFTCGNSSSEDHTMRVFVFTKATGYVHESIPEGAQAIRDLGLKHNFEVEVSDDSLCFNEQALSKYNVIVFMNTSGNVLGEAQQTVFKDYIQQGGGFVGVHGASVTEEDWPWYAQLLGARFKDHPEIQQATVKVIDKTHSSTKHLPDEWVREDEWYNFEPDISENIHVLAVIDESTYQGGSNGPNHPFAWYQTFEGGRSWYTAGGHKKEHYQDPLFQQHILGGILYAAGK